MPSPPTKLEWSPPRHPVWTRFLGGVYERGGVTYIRRAIWAQLGLACFIAFVATLYTRFYVPFSPLELAIMAALSIVVYVTDGTLAIRSMYPGLRALERWTRTGDERSACAAWEAMTDLPFAPLRMRATYPVVLGLIAGWDIVGTLLLDLSITSFVLLLPGSIMVWVYLRTLRFLLTEQLVRPALAEISLRFPGCSQVTRPRITQSRRLLVAVPAIAVFTGAAVTGIVGQHTIQTVVAGLAASILVTAVFAGWHVALLASSVAEPIADLRAAAERVGHGDLHVRVPVVSADETGALAGSFNRMIDGLRDRERIRDAFGTYVDPTVAEHILREGTSLAGEEVEVTALFLDVRGFTSYAERLPASTVVTALNRLFELVVPIVHRYGGHVDKFVGDGLLAVFGAPRRQSDHAEHALAAAREMAAAVEGRLDGELRIGIGLNSGIVVAGNIGGAGRFNFSVIGDAVNVAARIESATRQTGDTILLSGYTRRLLHADVQVELTPRPGVRLKGKTEHIVVYAPNRG